MRTCTDVMAALLVASLDDSNQGFDDMLRSLSGLANMMKQAQEMGSKMQAMSERLKTLRATGQAGGGMVEVEVNGLSEVLAVRIDESLFRQGDREMIEDLLPAAFNAAHAKAKELHQQAIGEMTSDLNVPGLEEALASLKGDAPPPGSTPPEANP